MGALSFSLLGPLRVTAADRTEVEIRGTGRQTLLAALLLEAGTVVSLDRLVELLWESERDDRTDSRIYNQITRLRQALPGAGDRVRAVPPGYLIEVEPGELDLHVFAEHNAAARAAAANGDWATASQRYAAALALWRGTPLADIPALAGQPEILRLDEERWAAILGRAEAELNLGRHAGLIPELRLLAREEPEREALHRQLMLALYRSGRRGEALDVYRALSRTLDEQFGLEPGLETRELHERIAHEDSARNQLPADTRLFTGREAEVDRLLALAKSTYANTVTISAVDGLGGVGKSALAVHVAHQMGSFFPDGQLFIDLRGHTKGLEPVTPHAALGYLLRSLDVPEQQIPADIAARTASLRERLTGTRTLILMDNAASTEQVRPLLPEVPGCMALITSRARLAELADAHAFSLDILPPAAARDLLRAAAGKNRIPAEEPALDDLLELCGYIPLALRIVGARLRHDRALTVATLVAELDAEGGRLRNLRDDERGLTEVFESSYAALPDTQRRALRLLGLIPGTDFGIHAAAALFEVKPEDADETLTTLVAHNLLTEPQHGHYRFHDLMRLYAREVAERDETEQSRQSAVERLLAWYTDTIRSAGNTAYPTWNAENLPTHTGTADPLDFTDVQQALDWYDRERDNLFAAVEVAERDGHLTYGWLLSAVLWPLIELRGRVSERLALAEIGLRCAERLQETRPRIRMLRYKCSALIIMRRFAEAIEIGEVTLEFTRQQGFRSDEARLLTNLNYVYQSTGQFEKAIECGRESLRLFELLGDENAELPARINLASALDESGRTAEAIPIISQAIELCRKPANRVRLGTCLAVLGDCLTKLDPPDYAGAEKTLLEALEEVRIAGNRHHESTALAKLGMICVATGRANDALEYLRASDQVVTDLGTTLYHGFKDALDRLEREAADSAP